MMDAIVQSRPTYQHAIELAELMARSEIMVALREPGFGIIRCLKARAADPVLAASYEIQKRTQECGVWGMF